MKKLLCLTVIVFSAFILSGCAPDRISLLEKQNQDLKNILTGQQNAINDRCYAHEDKKCVTNEEKEIIKLLPSNAILREIEPIPQQDGQFIGIYIENPVVNMLPPDADSISKEYLICYDLVRGQMITGVYHLFTYVYGSIDSDILIPKSTTLYNDYNSDLVAQRIGMSWKNTKLNNNTYFNGEQFSDSEQYNLEISKLINFKDYNGDGYPYEFILYGGAYMTCSDDEELIAGYDKDSDSAIIYKIKDESKKLTYWSDDFYPKEDGDVIKNWPCGDHGSDKDTTIFYKYSSAGEYYYFVNKIIKNCN